MKLAVEGQKPMYKAFAIKMMDLKVKLPDVEAIIETYRTLLEAYND